jgi:hypothetical protein
MLGGFKQWIHKTEETATSTSGVAVFARPIFPEMIKRQWTVDNSKKRKKKNS